jgi:hypothetical protein
VASGSATANTRTGCLVGASESGDKPWPSPPSLAVCGFCVVFDEPTRRRPAPERREDHEWFPGFAVALPLMIDHLPVIKSWGVRGSVGKATEFALVTVSQMAQEEGGARRRQESGHQLVGDTSVQEGAHRAELLVEVAVQLVVDHVPIELAVRSLDEAIKRHRHHQDDLSHRGFLTRTVTLLIDILRSGRPSDHP